MERVWPPWAPAAAIGSLIAVGAWYWWQPKSFDECMLSEMRGQQRFVFPNAEKVCESRFLAPKPVKASAAGLSLPPGFVLDEKP